MRYMLLAITPSISLRLMFCLLVNILEDTKVMFPPKEQEDISHRKWVKVPVGSELESQRAVCAVQN